MTFQVVLIGIEGIVLGSDKMFSEVHFYDRTDSPKREHATHSSPGTKILESDTGDIICAHAGGPAARDMARAILIKADPNGLSQARWEYQIKEILNPMIGTDPRITDELIIVRRNSNIAVKTVREGGGNVQVNSIEAHTCAGDIRLPARFLPTHLWQREMPIGQLKRLAILTLACAHKENPTGVGCGYDLVIADKGGKITAERVTEAQGREASENFLAGMRGLI